MSNVSLSLLVLKTRQLDNLRRFYGCLGIDLLQEQHARGPVHYAGLVGATVLEIYPLPDDATPADATTRLGFAVENMAEIVLALQALGARVITPIQSIPAGLRAVVRDPDGRAVEISQQATPPSFAPPAKMN